MLKLSLKTGGEAEYNKLREAYKKMETNQDKKQVYQTIGATQDSQKKKDALMWSISGDIKIQDFFYIMGGVRASSREGMTLAMEFMKTEFEGIKKLVGSANPSIYDAVIQSCVNGHASTKIADEIEQFFEANPMPQNKRTISQVLEGIRSDAKSVDAFLASDIVKPEFWTSLQEVLK